MFDTRHDVKNNERRGIKFFYHSLSDGMPGIVFYDITGVKKLTNFDHVIT